MNVIVKRHYLKHDRNGLYIISFLYLTFVIKNRKHYKVMGSVDEYFSMALFPIVCNDL